MPIILTHWGRVTHICDSELIIIGSDNGLSPGRRQAIIWANAGILLIGPLGTNFSEIVIELYRFSFKKIHLKMSSGKWRPSCLGLNVLKHFDGCWFAGKVAHLTLNWTWPKYKKNSVESATIIYVNQSYWTILVLLIPWLSCSYDTQWHWNRFDNST